MVLSPLALLPSSNAVEALVRQIEGIHPQLAVALFIRLRKATKLQIADVFTLVFV
jgi:hypothetical protein